MRKPFVLLIIAQAFSFLINAQSVDTIKVRVHDHVMTLIHPELGNQQ